MAGTNIVGGKVFIDVNGRRIAVKGNVTYSLGNDKREAVMGSDTVHGFKSMPQVPYIEFATTDIYELNIKELQNLVNATVVLQKPNGKTCVWSKAVYAGEGTISTEEGEVACRFEAEVAEEYAS